MKTDTHRPELQFLNSAAFLRVTADGYFTGLRNLPTREPTEAEIREALIQIAQQEEYDNEQVTR